MKQKVIIGIWKLVFVVSLLVIRGGYYTAEGPIVVELQDAFMNANNPALLEKSLQSIQQKLANQSKKRFDDDFDHIIFQNIQSRHAEDKKDWTTAVKYLKESYTTYNALSLSEQEEFCRLEDIDYSLEVKKRDSLHVAYEERLQELIWSLEKAQNIIIDTSKQDGFWEIILPVGDLVPPPGGCPLIYTNSSLDNIKVASRYIGDFISEISASSPFFKQASLISSEGHANKHQCCCTYQGKTSLDTVVYNSLDTTQYIVKRRYERDTVKFSSHLINDSTLSIKENVVLAATRGERYLSAIKDIDTLKGIKTVIYAIPHHDTSEGTRGVQISFLMPNIELILFMAMLNTTPNEEV